MLIIINRIIRCRRKKLNYTIVYRIKILKYFRIHICWWKFLKKVKTFLAIGIWSSLNFVNFDSLCSSRVWPLSLLALRQVAKDLQLNRDHRTDESAWRCDRREKSECSSENFVLGNKSERLRDTPDKHNNLFLKHVKIKKRHEIQQIARVQLHFQNIALCEIFVDPVRICLSTDMRRLCARVQCQMHCRCWSRCGPSRPIFSI